MSRQTPVPSLLYKTHFCLHLNPLVVSLECQGQAVAQARPWAEGPRRPSCPSLVSGTRSCLAQSQSLEETLGSIHPVFKARLCVAGSRTPAKPLTGTHWALVEATAACSKVASCQRRSLSEEAWELLRSWKWRLPRGRRPHLRASVRLEAAKVPSITTVSLSETMCFFSSSWTSVASSQPAFLCY